LLDEDEPDPCRLYHLWITYLILETAPKPACQVEPTFVRATDAIQSNALCPPGYAFLSAYYLDRRLIERSQSFLDEALRLAPDDTWVKLVEAVFHEEAYYDDPKAIQVLEELTQKHPSFPLAHYLLGRLYIRREDYGKGNASFQSLKKDVKGQVAFWRIRRGLSSLEKTGDSGQEKAENLLAMSRAFTTLKDFPMAEHLYRWILREMPDRLAKEEQLAAYCELGQLYETRGDRRSAYDAYRDALDIDPEFQDAHERIRHLFPDQANQS
jgi:cytochrome c-type biogenesis protein CcmH/NrfG